MSYITLGSTGLTNPLQEILMADNVQAGDSISYELCKLLWEYHPLGGKIVEKPGACSEDQARHHRIHAGPLTARAHLDT